MIAYAIWYGDMLDGVTTNTMLANRAEKRGAVVLDFELPNRELRMSDVPRPGLPLGWEGVEVVT